MVCPALRPKNDTSLLKRSVAYTTASADFRIGKRSMRGLLSGNCFGAEISLLRNLCSNSAAGPVRSLLSSWRLCLWIAAISALT